MRKISFAIFYAAVGLTVLLLLSAISPAEGRCQSIQVMIKPTAYRMDSIGTARIECRYGYSWLKDTTARMSADGGLLSGDSADVERGMMLLQCGRPSGVSRFYSYDRFYLDSLMLASEGGGGTAVDVWSLPSGTAFTVYKNFPEQGRMTSTDAIGTENYLVEEAVPDFGWRVLDEWKEVLGYRVRRAECTFRGRDYVAWFAPELPVSEGPWKFCGLPGLILEVYDTRLQYHYVLQGLTVADDGMRVEMPDAQYIRTDVEKYLRTLRRYTENPMLIMSEVDASAISAVRVTKPADESDPFKLKFDFQEIL